MVTLHRQPTWRVSLYGREHGAPHFHLEGRTWRCSIKIDTLEVIVGHAPKREFAAAVDWAGSRKAHLLATWRELNP